MKLVVPCLLLLVGCGPVLLGEEESMASGGAGAGGGVGGGHAGASGATPGMSDASVAEPSFPPPSVVVRIKALDCGACFELLAQGLGGLPPYAFEWADGSRDELRSVCVDGAGAILSVVATDASGAPSEPYVVHLDHAVDASCPDPVEQPDASVPTEVLCVENPSFEGTPAISFGDPMVFDADPWSLCSNRADFLNAPDIGNETVAVTPNVLSPSDGSTYLALGELEQVSQELCEPITGDVPLHFEIDLARADLGEVPASTEQVFVEIWGGLSVDCSQRELLWVSRALDVGWQHYCVTLRPRSYMTQLTLRGGSDMTSSSTLSHALVDNMRPVGSCP